MAATTEIPLNNESKNPAILEPSTNGENLTKSSLDISNQVTTIIENANVVRLRYIHDFILQLEKDFNKYGGKKRLLIKIKNTILVIDFIIGTILILASIILQLIGMESKILSAILSGVGALCFSVIPVVTKITEMAANKHRNFEYLSVKKLNMCKQIFCRSLEDGKISQEELMEVFECKRQYETAKEILEINNQKDVEHLFNRDAVVNNEPPNLNKSAIQQKIDGLINSMTNQADLRPISNNSYIYPSLTSMQSATPTVLTATSNV